jgi:hypothetical protein
MLAKVATALWAGLKLLFLAVPFILLVFLEMVLNMWDAAKHVIVEVKKTLIETYNTSHHK